MKNDKANRAATLKIRSSVRAGIVIGSIKEISIVIGS
jgi:hypothetical protein